MADYRTHLLGGMVAGAAAAATAAWFAWTEPWRLPLVGVVGVVGGLAPDIDSDNSRPVKILFRTAAVVIPTALVWRVAPLHAVPERALVAWVLLASFVRWPLCWLFKRATVHRGIFHSVPAIVIFGCACFLFAGRRAEDVTYQIAVGLTAAVGYLTHLALDELWSVDFEGRTIRVKKSLGTALKPWGKVAWHNGLAWGLVAVLGGLVWKGLDGITVEDLLDGYDDAALEAVEGLRLERR